MEEAGQAHPQSWAEWDERLLRLVANHPAPVVLHDGISILHANDRVAHLFGFDPPETLVGQRIADLIHPDDMGRVRDRTEEVYRSGGGAPLVEMRFRRRDGAVLLLETATQAVDLAGRRTILVIGRDITRERDLEESLERELIWRKALNRVATASNAAQSLEEALGPCLDAVAAAAFPTLDSASTSIVCHAFVRNRRHPDEVAERRFWRLKDHARCGSFRETLDEARLFQDVGLARQILATGQPVWIRDVSADPNFSQATEAAECGVAAAAGCPITYRDEIIGVLECFADKPHDIDELLLGAMAQVGRQLSHVVERERGEEERDRLLLDLKSALEMANQAVHQRDEFFSVAAHELYTPLTSLELALHSMKDPESSAGQEARLLAVARRQSDRLVRLVSSLLDLSRIDTGRLKLNPSEVDLSDLVREVVARFAGELRATRSRLDVEAPPGVLGRWDRSRVDQVVTNLLANAIKYGANRPIRILVSTDAGRARLRVTDLGIGISPDRLPHIFERFERAAPAEHFGGLGLGLFIVREIVERHSGTVSIESKFGEGTSVTVELPLAGRET